MLPEFSPDHGLLGQSRYPCSGGCLATSYSASQTAFSQPSPLGIARSTTDADDPLGSGSTQRHQALPALRFDLGETFEQSMQVESITHRPWLKHRHQLWIIHRETFPRGGERPQAEAAVGVRVDLATQFAELVVAVETPQHTGSCIGGASTEPASTHAMAGDARGVEGRLCEALHHQREPRRFH